LCYTLPFSALTVSLVAVLLGKSTQGKITTKAVVVDVSAMPTRQDESCSKMLCDTAINFDLENVHFKSRCVILKRGLTAEMTLAESIFVH
jgi:hypothetical protein